MLDLGIKEKKRRQLLEPIDRSCLSPCVTLRHDRGAFLLSRLRQSCRMLHRCGEDLRVLVRMQMYMYVPTYTRDICDGWHQVGSHGYAQDMTLPALLLLRLPPMLRARAKNPGRCGDWAFLPRRRGGKDLDVTRRRRQRLAAAIYGGFQQAPPTRRHGGCEGKRRPRSL